MTCEEVYDAVSKADATKFQQLLQQDPFLVERVSFPCSRNLLHIATLQGQAAMVDEVLKIKPQLARDLDSKNSSPLHIAATQGNVEIASRLLRAAPEMCWCRDDQGMNPVHVAATKGQVEMLKELLWRDPLPAMERVKRGQTVLHLCVKHHQLGSLTFLGNKLGDLVYAKDDDGETLLHWAVRSYQVEMIRYLVDNFKTMKQSTNSMGKTAYEILEESPKQMFTCLIGHWVSPPSQLLPPSFWSSPETLEILTKKKEQTMVVMTLIATMAFQAVVSPPGGVWQENSPSHRAGEAVMAYTHPNIYKNLIRANTTAFISSLLTIFMVAVHPRIGKGFLLVFSSYVVWVSLASIAVSYGGSLLVILPNTQREMLAETITVVVAISVSFFVITLLGDIVSRCLSNAGVDCSYLFYKLFRKVIATVVKQDLEKRKLDKLGLDLSVESGPE